MEVFDIQTKGETIVLPEDCRGTVEYLLCTVLNTEEEKIIRLRFEQYLSVSEMMELCGYTNSVMIELIMRIIRKLRHPARTAYLRYGVAGVLEQKAEQIQNDSYLQGYQDGYQDRTEEQIVLLEEDNLRIERIRRELPEYITDLQLPPRIHNALRRVGIYRVEDLLNLSKSRLLSVTGIGVRTVEQICAFLEEKGFSLKDENTIGKCIQ